MASSQTAQILLYKIILNQYYQYFSGKEPPSSVNRAVSRKNSECVARVCPSQVNIPPRLALFEHEVHTPDMDVTIDVVVVRPLSRL